jgi:SAM-dependent methyltransferase
LKDYYDKRASEYDATSYELVQDDPQAQADLAELEGFIASLSARASLDIGCGTGWLTRRLSGAVVGVDQSAAMLEIALQRVPWAAFVRASVPPLPFGDEEFDLCFSSHFYGHLHELERRQLVNEALRVGRTFVVIEQAWQEVLPSELYEPRRLRDGSEHHVFKRYLTGRALADELGGELVIETTNFIGVRLTRPDRRES